MKKEFLLSGLIALSILGLQCPAQADHDDWYKKHDANNDGRWDHNEYSNAQREWELAHQRRHQMSDKELHEYYGKLDRNKDGYLAAEEAQRAHHW